MKSMQEKIKKSLIFAYRKHTVWKMWLHGSFLELLTMSSLEKNHLKFKNVF